MGFYSLAVVYGMTGIFSLFSAKVLDKIGARYSLLLGSALFVPYLGSFIIAARPEFSYELKVACLLVGAAFNGLGAALLWTAQGSYVSMCASDENKGLFFSTFWAFFMSSMIVGTLMGAFVITEVS